MKGEPWTAEDQKTAETMKAFGHTWREMAAVLGRSTSTIRRHLNPEFAARARDASARWHRENPDKSKEANRRFRINHPDYDKGRKR
jgi:IS30 family transposase